MFNGNYFETREQYFQTVVNRVTYIWGIWATKWTS